MQVRPVLSGKSADEAAWERCDPEGPLRARTKLRIASAWLARPKRLYRLPPWPQLPILVFTTLGDPSHPCSLWSARRQRRCRVSIVVVQTVEGWSSSVAIVSKRHSIATRWPADGTRSSARSTHRSHQLPVHAPGTACIDSPLTGHVLRQFGLRNARAASYESSRYLA